jgi:hypothetical protein
MSSNPWCLLFTLSRRHLLLFFFLGHKRIYLRALRSPLKIICSSFLPSSFLSRPLASTLFCLAQFQHQLSKSGMLARAALLHDHGWASWLPIPPLPPPPPPLSCFMGIPFPRSSPTGNLWSSHQPHSPGQCRPRFLKVFTCTEFRLFYWYTLIYMCFHLHLFIKPDLVLHCPNRQTARRWRWRWRRRRRRRRFGQVEN